MQHLDEGTIHSWLDGALSADEAARVEAHVAECPQCAATVAEARGFIAASSRILTALDHVPRGVVPAAPAAKWYNRAAWRAAAALLVVAVGSLVLVRNNDRKAIVATASSDTIGVASTAAMQPQIVAPSQPTTEADFSGKRAGSVARPNVVARERARSDAAPVARPQVAGAVIAPQSPVSSRVSGVTMMDAAREQPLLKEVGRPRMVGAKVTLYEVAPGDTVTLIELLSMQLEGTATGVSSAQPLMSRAAGKSAAAPTQRANATDVSVPDSQSRAKIAGASAVPPAAPAPLQVEVVNGVTTITWPDVTTGNMLKLSGRMPVERLQEIKRRIERERSAAAKKSP